MLKQIKLESGDVVVIDSQIVGHLSGWIDSNFSRLKKIYQNLVFCLLLFLTPKRRFISMGFFVPNSCIPLGHAMGEQYLGQYPGTRQVDMVPLYCALISKELVKKLGIPETLGTDIFEDANYCMQAMANNFKIYATDKLAVVYQGAPKTNKEYQAFCPKFLN